MQIESKKIESKRKECLMIQRAAMPSNVDFDNKALRGSFVFYPLPFRDDRKASIGKDELEGELIDMRTATTGFFFCFVLMLFTLSCAKPNEEIIDPVVPDVGTQADRTEIARIVNQVQSFSDFYGLHYDFHSVPIRIVRSFSDGSDAHGGLCVRSRSRFIEIREDVLVDREVTWNIVVHELGHCVLDREHDDAMMDLEGKHVSLQRGSRNFLIENGEVPISIMATHGSWFLPRDYYLKELLGLARYSKISEIRKKYRGAVVIEEWPD